MSDPLPITLTINGETKRAFVQPWHTLLHVLRDFFHGCNQTPPFLRIYWIIVTTLTKRAGGRPGHKRMPLWIE